jgi:uncharacterized protein YndB with AHSA1/START domain
MTTDDRPLAVPQRTADGWIVRFERRLAHPREKVWRALTESEHLAHWLPCDIVGERRAGAAIELPFWPAHVERYDLGDDISRLTGEIRVWDPPSVFEWTWDTDILRWELTDLGDVTLLTFTTWLAPDDSGAAKTAAGYHACLDQLQELLDTGTTVEPLVDGDVTPLEVRYKQAVEAAS